MIRSFKINISNKIVEDIIRSGRIQKDDLTIVVVDGK